MTITKNQNGTCVTLNIEGRLDTITAPDLEKEIQLLGEAHSLEVNCKDLEYISSAGLRVLFAAHKSFTKKGGMTITNVKDILLEIFDVTGFRNILNIK
ncbi:MAG: STAS domain-containing protein [Treponema sp.]|nr:STAS domain-containing protein [Treponema sp.]